MLRELFHSRPFPPWQGWQANHSRLISYGAALSDDSLKGLKTAVVVCVHGSWHKSLIAYRQTKGVAINVNCPQPNK